MDRPHCTWRPRTVNGTSPKAGHRKAPGHPSIGGGTQDTDFNKEFTKGMFTNFLPIFSLKFRVPKLRFLAFPRGPGGFRELREAGRNHFHRSWYLLLSVVTSYDP